MAVHSYQEADFQKEVLHRKGLCLVDFWAPWCGPCRMLAPILEQVEQELRGRATVGKVDVEQEPTLAGRYQVQTVPTVVYFLDGAEVCRSVGLVTKQKLMDLALELL